MKPLSLPHFFIPFLFLLPSLLSGQPLDSLIVQAQVAHSMDATAENAMKIIQKAKQHPNASDPLQQARILAYEYTFAFDLGTRGLTEVIQNVEKSAQKLRVADVPALWLGQIHELLIYLYQGLSPDKSVTSLTKIQPEVEMLASKGEQKALIVLLLGLDYSYYNQSDYERAFEQVQRVINILDTVSIGPDTEYLSFAARQSAINSAVMIGRSRDAVRYCLEAIELLHANPSKFVDPKIMEAETFWRLAGTYAYMGDYALDIQYIRQAIRIFANAEERVNYPEIGISLYVSAAFAHNRVKQYKRARYYVTQAEKSGLELQKLYPDADLSKEWFEVYEAGFISYSREDKHEDSLTYFHKKLQTIYDQLDTYDKSRVHVSSANFFKFKKDYRQAIKELEQCITLKKQVLGGVHFEIAEAYTLLAQIYKKVGKPIKAYEVIEQALMALLLTKDEEKADPAALFDLKAAVSTLQEKVNILFDLYQIDKSVHHLTEVLKTSKFGARVFETWRTQLKSDKSKAFLLEPSNWMSIFEKGLFAAYTLPQQQSIQVEQMFFFMEHSKSVLLMDAFRETEAQKIGGVPEHLIRQEDSIARIIQVYDKQIFEARQMNNLEEVQTLTPLRANARLELDYLKQIYERRYPKYYEYKYEEQDLVDSKTLQEDLQPGDLVLEYFEGEQGVYILGISKDKITKQYFVRDSLYNANYARFYKAITEINYTIQQPENAYKDLTDGGSFFYKKLLKNHLRPTTQRLIIIPDGQLNYIPFEALLETEVTGNLRYSELPYLIKSYPVSYHYSGTMLHEVHVAKKEHYSTRIGGFAPKYVRSDTHKVTRSTRLQRLRGALDELPGAKQEIQVLSDAFVSAAFQDAEATEHIFKQEAQNFGVLHLAMHGVINETHPEYSGLVFTEDGDSTQDNFLHAYEIRELDLNAGLVFLSACETGNGKYQYGEGVVSIGRGFMYAGVPSLIMSLWQVNDMSSAAISKYFYDNLNEGLEKDYALREAKLEYLSQSDTRAAHPFYWTAFVQLGERQRLNVERYNILLNPWVLGGGIIVLLALFGLVNMRSKRLS